MRYKNIFLVTKNTNLESSTIHLVGGDMIQIAELHKRIFIYKKRINIGLFAVRTLESSFTWYRHERYIY